MLTTLVYRFGPPGTEPKADRAMANGQCMTLRRERFLDAGGMSLVAGEVVEDVALARRLAIAGWKIGFLDAADLLSVRMFETLGDTWTGWGRSLALPGVESRGRQILDLAVVLLAQALPLPRVLLGRGDVIDLVLVANRGRDTRRYANRVRPQRHRPTGPVRWPISAPRSRSLAVSPAAAHRPGAGRTYT